MTYHFRVFLASPGDVSIEREALARAVDEINETTCPLLNCTLEPVKWETHATPGGGRPQQVINEQLGDYDIFVGVMWRRFGTPSDVAGSGTEEEYRLAYKRWENSRDMPLMFYFCEAPFYPKTIDELDQMRQVMAFRKEIEGKALAWAFDDHAAFEPAIRKHLCQRLPRLVEARNGDPRARAKPIDSAIEALQAIWPKLDEKMQSAFNIAYNENRLTGDPGIQTSDLFSALLRIEDPSLQGIVSEIRPSALPEATKGPVSERTYILEERPWLSGCVASSIRRLERSAPEGYRITPTDVFADIAKNGTGPSVALLRKHNIRPSDIDALLRKRNITTLEAAI